METLREWDKEIRVNISVNQHELLVDNTLCQAPSTLSAVAREVHALYVLKPEGSGGRWNPSTVDQA